MALNVDPRYSRPFNQWLTDNHGVSPRRVPSEAVSKWIDETFTEVPEYTAHGDWGNTDEEKIAVVRSTVFTLLALEVQADAHGIDDSWGDLKITVAVKMFQIPPPQMPNFLCRMAAAADLELDSIKMLWMVCLVATQPVIAAFAEQHDEIGYTDAKFRSLLQAISMVVSLDDTAQRGQVVGMPLLINPPPTPEEEETPTQPMEECASCGDNPDHEDDLEHQAEWLEDEFFQAALVAPWNDLVDVRKSLREQEHAWRTASCGDDGDPAILEMIQSCKRKAFICEKVLEERKQGRPALQRQNAVVVDLTGDDDE